MAKRNFSHFLRMNPATYARAPRVLSLTNIAIGLVLLVFAALFWIGKLHSH